MKFYAKGKRERHNRRLILRNDDIKKLIENKKKAYLRYLTTRSETDKLEYKRLVAVVERETRKIKRHFGKQLYRELNMVYVDDR